MTKKTDEKESAAAGARKQDVVKLAEERARRADAAVVAAEEEVAEAEAALEAVDPGNEKGFDRGIARRAQARARLDELRDRATFAHRAVEVERERAKAAERAALRSELEMVEGHIRAIDREIVKAALECFATIREGISLVTDYSGRGAELDAQLGDPIRRNRSTWAYTEPGDELRAMSRCLELLREQEQAALEARAKKAAEAAERDRPPQTQKKP